MTERVLKPGERIQYACEHWYEAGSYGVRLHRDIPNLRCPACQRAFEERAIAAYGNDRLTAAQEGVVKALKKVKSIAASHRVTDEPGRLTATEATERIVAIAHAALKELGEAQK